MYEGHRCACAITSNATILPYRDPEILRLRKKELPVNFDARTQWPNCPTIKEIYDQGSCGSCWTFGTAATASDRTCIHLKTVVRLSEQDLECCPCHSDEGVCGGGDPNGAFQFWVSNGLVTQKCKPYNEDESQRPRCSTKCVDGVTDYNTDKHFGESSYAIRDNEREIMNELYTNGPIQATMKIYSDFPEYQGNGVYEHKYGDYLDFHSVRVIGYGEENGVKYWLGANSWGKKWGNGGYFKIKRFDPDVQFENGMCSGMPKA